VCPKNTGDFTGTPTDHASLRDIRDLTVTGEKIMNIQIFGKAKSFDTKKAQMFFKERNVRFQYIDLLEKGMSRGEFESVSRAVGGWENLIDPKTKDQETLSLLRYLVPEEREAKLFENQQLLKMPVVRNGKQATAGCKPEVWKTWMENAVKENSR
jgi:arsenate reductase